jgi:hypothetical protein
MPNVMNVVERSPEIDVDAKMFYESALRDLNDERGVNLHRRPFMRLNPKS